MLGDNIKNFRQKKKLSLNKLAKLSGIATGYLSDLENNKCINPSQDKLNKLADVLQVKIEDFYKEDPDEIDKLEADMKILYSKVKNLTPNDRKKILKIIEQFEKENNE